MASSRLPAERCTNMIEVRQAVDEMDQAIASLLGERFALMRAAAGIKAKRKHVRDESRRAEVVRKAVERAAIEDVPAAAIEDLYERLVEHSIAYELVQFDALQAARSARTIAG
jgi:isochorismate pyruvate lyase